MIQFDIIKNKLRTLIDSSAEISISSALPTEQENLLNCIEEGDHKAKSYTTEFTIQNRSTNGFHVLCEGKAGYIKFHNMPWQYSNKKYWKTIFRYLLEYTFPAQINTVDDDSNALSLCGRIIQFQEPSFEFDQLYKAIIVRKNQEYIILEFGYHFDWQHGSILVKTPLSAFRYKSRDKFLQAGQVFKVFYWGKKKNGERIFGAEYEQKKWITNEIEETIKQLTEKTTDKTIPVVIQQIELYQSYTSIFGLIDNEYHVEIPISRASHTSTPYSIVSQAIRHLVTYETIHCEVLHICREDQKIIMKWSNVDEITKVAQRSKQERQELVKNIQKKKNQSIQNKRLMGCIPEKATKKQMLVGKIITIEIIKQKDTKGHNYNHYFIDNIHTVKLNIYNKNKQITTRNFNIIERNLQNRDMINCEIMNIENDTLVVRWDIQDKEFERFIK